MAWEFLEIEIDDVTDLVWPVERLDDYNPDLQWNEETGTWEALITGGGRYKNQIVIVGHNTVYFGEI